MKNIVKKMAKCTCEQFFKKFNTKSIKNKLNLIKKVICKLMKKIQKINDKTNVISKI